MQCSPGNALPDVVTGHLRKQQVSICTSSGRAAEQKERRNVLVHRVEGEGGKGEERKGEDEVGLLCRDVTLEVGR